MTIGYLINLFILKENKLGFPMATLTLDNMVVFLKVCVDCRNSAGRKHLPI